jgi:hypothetical protein
MKLEHIKVEQIWAVVLDAAIQAEGRQPLPLVHEMR